MKAGLSRKKRADRSALLCLFMQASHCPLGVSTAAAARGEALTFEALTDILADFGVVRGDGTDLGTILSIFSRKVGRYNQIGFFQESSPTCFVPNYRLSPA